jgi:hypothetical protein
VHPFLPYSRCLCTSLSFTELATLTGVKSAHAPPPPLLNPHHKAGSDFFDDVDDNDPLDPLASSSGSTRSGQSDHLSRYQAANTAIVLPSIVVLPEYKSMMRKGDKDGKMTVTSVIVVEIPERLKVSMPTDYSEHQRYRGATAPPITHQPQQHRVSEFGQPSLLPPFSMSSGAPNSTPSAVYPSPDELRRRLISSDGSLSTATLDNLSTLLASDKAFVRSAPSASSSSRGASSKDREFLVYLFKEALLCVSESGPASTLKSKGTSLFKRKPSSSQLRNGNGSGNGSGNGDEKVLKLKGKVFVHHMRGVIDGLRLNSPSSSSFLPSLCMTILMTNQDTDDFIVAFSDRATKERWWDRITYLIPIIGRDGKVSTAPFAGTKQLPEMPMSPPGSIMSGNSGKLSAILGVDPRTVNANMVGRSPSLMGNNVLNSMSAISQLRSSPFSDNCPNASPTTPGFPQSPPISNVFPSTTHTPLDLLLVLSLHAPDSSSSATALRTRVIRSSLSFIMSTLSPRDRLSVITYENGEGGVIRKTPFLAVGRNGEGKRRMLDLLDTIGNENPNEEVDERLIVLNGQSREEKANVVSAVNVGKQPCLPIFVPDLLT